MTSRRQFIAGLLATGLAPAPTWADAGSPAYLSAAMTPEGAHVLVGLGGDGAERFRLPVPARGHAAAAHPTQPFAVAFARRPGTFAVVIDCRTGEVTARLDAPEGRHFYGHGAFDAAGEVLYATENDYEAGVGRIGLWDAARGFARIDDISSHGVGPHEIRRMPDGTFVVANGGIDTHPDTGRTKLNIPTMRPNLAYLAADGTLLDSVEPPDTLSSVRHISVRDDGLVAVGMQWQGDLAASPVMAALHRRGGAWQTLDEIGALDGYVGSVAFSDSGGEVGFTSPQAGRVEVLALREGAVKTSHALGDVCGVAARGTGFLCTTGEGQVVRIGADTVATTSTLRYDNHLVRI